MSGIVPVILSGGAGTRLWPVSRAAYPKQFLPLTSDKTLLQETALRVAGATNITAPIIVSSEAHRFIIGAQLAEAGIVPQAHMLEPCGRNTAPAVAAAARLVRETDPEAILLVLPADHHIADAESFLDAVSKGAHYAGDGRLVTFGMPPTHPHTGYGYLRRGERLGAGGGFTLERFVEKPDQAQAEVYVAEGDYDWNAGIFMFRADVLLAEMEKYCPDILARAAQSVEGARRGDDFVRLDSDAFEACPADSIDYAVMEHTERGVIVPAEMGWSDVGSWASLWELGDQDSDGNVTVGDVIAIDTVQSYIRSESILVTVLGVDNLVIVEAGDGILVAARDKLQDVRKIVEELKNAGRSEVESRARVHRPWGFFEPLHVGDGHQVKHLMVKPGAKLSLQSHKQRSEHWTVAKGTARVMLDDTIVELSENQSVDIPIGCRHRLENSGTSPLSVIEVQFGAYLGEDDIERFDDDYGRLAERDVTT